MHVLARKLLRHSRITVLLGVVTLLTLMAAPMTMAHANTAEVLLPRHISISLTDTGFTMPAKLPEGLLDITATNNGTFPHEVQFFHLFHGVTPAQVIAALQGSNPFAIFAVARYAGGAEPVLPGGNSQEVFLNFSPAQYVAVDLVTLAYVAFTVVGNDEGQIHLPTVSGTAVLSNTNRDFDIGIPHAMHFDRPTTIRVENQGTQVHELNILALLPGVTPKQLLACISTTGCNPFALANLSGGMNGLAPGDTGWMTLNLPRGIYLASCFMPDRKTGLPHFFLGMYQFFTVY